ncbi:MAG: hypothetical protein IJT86_03055 [Spirochaetales bacterium]|nr:hypothetical protein [Spirochaetales bacterium]MBQ4501614.1 hypothetical protein [Spirochaetales bacterium]MBQ7729310.1 hypothetical protein [Spirochaetales bacterium]MBQ9810871.1 hypothetical protein [Spirochaetales bacterium]MBR4478307.1 hypothetical protein [Spirochaetales bacterium]
MKKTFYTELAYVLGLIFVALGVAFMEKPDFGVSMVVAPAYILHLKISETYSFFTFGMAEYTLQAVLLIIMALVLRRFKLSYLFSFVTAVIYGFILDLCMLLVSYVPMENMALRITYYTLGMVLCAIGIALFFHTYIAPEVYELFVKEVSSKYGVEIHRFKTGYDICSCLIGVILSFIFFGFGVFRGVKWGTIICALINGTLIGLCSKFLEQRFEFKDGLGLRKYF